MVIILYCFTWRCLKDAFTVLQVSQAPIQALVQVLLCRIILSTRPFKDSLLMCFRCKWQGGTKSKKSPFCAIIYSSLVLQIRTREEGVQRAKYMRGPERSFKADVRSRGTGVTGPFFFNYRARKTRESVWKRNLLSLTALYSLACMGLTMSLLFWPRWAHTVSAMSVPSCRCTRTSVRVTVGTGEKTLLFIDLRFPGQREDAQYGQCINPPFTFK